MSNNSVLHIWSTAGIGAILAYGLRRKGWKSHCTVRSGYDPFFISQHYGCETRNETGAQFTEYALLKAKSFDIVHVHALPKLIPLFRKMYPKKKLILHYHGSDLSNNTNPVQIKKLQSFANKVIVSTPDLLEFEPNAIYLPNPIDTELFTNKSNWDANLYISSRYLIDEKVKEIAASFGVNQYFTIDREKQITKYKDMPSLLNGYSLYIDIKPSTWMPVKDALSTTGLQALACGLQVLTPSGFKYGFPKEHSLKRVIQKLEEIYE